MPCQDQQLQKILVELEDTLKSAVTIFCASGKDVSVSYIYIYDSQSYSLLLLHYHLVEHNTSKNDICKLSW